MEVKPIDANALKKQAYPFPCAIGTELAVPLRAINDAPTLDLAPVVRGEWVELSKTILPGVTRQVRCSCCQKEREVINVISLVEYTNFNPFCSDCGADMRGGGIS